MNNLMRFSDAERHSIEIDEWLSGQPHHLFSIARSWFSLMRECGPDVNELMHDGCPVACVQDAAFAYVNVFTAHVNVGFFLGATLEDPAGLLEGTGKRMRHVKVKPGRDLNWKALEALIQNAYTDMKTNLQNA
ncbi:MAG: DUF1801 domain-containing protein [Proteobacteria bacterium]|nr:DUF1801 domain-containing protein [Pseudomonadota bacterium]